jgi:HSP20 family protein
MFRNYNSASGAHGCGPASGKYGNFRGEHFRRPKYNLPINIADNETNFEVYVYALGYAKENIKISVQDDIIVHQRYAHCG